jgi:hypothetical protein
VWNNRLFRSCQNLWGEKTLEIKRNKPTWADDMRLRLKKETRRIQKCSYSFLLFRWGKRLKIQENQYRHQQRDYSKKKTIGTTHKSLLLVHIPSDRNISEKKERKRCFENFLTASVTTASLWGHYVSQILYTQVLFSR